MTMTCATCFYSDGTENIIMCRRFKPNGRYMNASDHCDYWSKDGSNERRVLEGDIAFTINNADLFMIQTAPQHLKQYTGPLDVVIDMGAHVGTFTCVAAKRGAVVYAVEPEPENFKTLVKNVIDNELQDKVHCINLAVTNKTAEQRELRGGKGNTGQHSLLYKDAYPVESSVTTVSLKDLLTSVLKEHGKIDYAKMDIEGEEFEVFEEDEELKKLIGEVNHWEVSVHPLDNDEYFTGEKKDYKEIVRQYMASCGVEDERLTLDG